MNRRKKDEIILILIFLAIFIFGIFVGKSLAQIKVVNERIIEEFRNNPQLVEELEQEYRNKDVEKSVARILEKV